MHWILGYCVYDCLGLIVAAAFPSEPLNLRTRVQAEAEQSYLIFVLVLDYQLEIKHKASR